MNELYKKKLVDDCIQLIQTLKLAYGDDTGSQVWKEMATHLDSSTQGEIMFNIIKGVSATHVTVIPNLSSIRRSTDELIKVIKLLRTLTGQGLKESKDLGEKLMTDRQSIKVLVQPGQRQYAIKEFEKIGYTAV